MDKTNLYKALALAKNPGNCLYVERGQPCCIIAQLYVLEGGTVEEMEGGGKFKEWSTIRRVYIDRAPTQLTKYPMNLLIAMQANWDSRNIFDSMSSRIGRIKQLIDEF